MSSTIIVPIQFKESMLDYAKEEWVKTFQFEYAGSLSMPPNSDPGRKVAGYCAVASFKAYGPDSPTSEEEIRLWVDNELFRRDSRTLPQSIIGEIYDDIVQHILRYTNNQDNQPVPINVPIKKGSDFRWTSDLVHSQYPSSPESSAKNFQHYACYLHGTVMQSTIDESGNEQKILQQYVMYIGVFSSYVV